MNRGEFGELLARRALRLDGALSTRLPSRPGDGLPAEAWNLLDPDRVMDLHRSYLRAGCQILRTNTFGACRETLAAAGMAGRVEELNRAGVRLARGAAQGGALVAGVVGCQPPLRVGSGGEGLERYREALGALIDAGPDLIVLETFTDPREAADLVSRLCRQADLPVVLFLSGPDPGETGPTESLAQALADLEALGADAVGFNCSSGPAAAVRVLRAAAARCRGPLAAAPSAGLPARGPGGELAWPQGPEEWAAGCVPLPWDRVRLYGGCCGTGPDHLRALRAALPPPLHRRIPDGGSERHPARETGGEAPGTARRSHP